MRSAFAGDSVATIDFGNIRGRVRGFPQVAVGGFDLVLKAMVLFDELGVRVFELCVRRRLRRSVRVGDDGRSLPFTQDRVRMVEAKPLAVR